MTQVDFAVEEIAVAVMMLTSTKTTTEGMVVVVAGTVRVSFPFLFRLRCVNRERVLVFLVLGEIRCLFLFHLLTLPCML